MGEKDHLRNSVGSGELVVEHGVLCSKERMVMHVCQIGPTHNAPSYLTYCNVNSLFFRHFVQIYSTLDTCKPSRECNEQIDP